MLESYQEIVESFTSQQYFGNAHYLHSGQEGVDSCAYIELKPRYPENKDVQFATLWRLLELHDPDQDSSAGSDELQEQLRVQFQYILDSWNPLPAERTHKERVKDEFEKCQNSITKNTKEKNVRADEIKGYYLNGKYRGDNFPTEVVRKFLNLTPSFVVSDEWNDFMVVYEFKNVQSMFYWSTSA